MANTTTGTHVRWMINRDMDEVLDIERRSFPMPWTEQEFIARLRKKTVIGMVAERDERIVGFVVYENGKERIEVENFAVHPEERRTGVGRAMIDKLKSKLSKDRRWAINLEVRETNLAAQLFFKSQGFLCVATLRNHYPNTEEDALLMAYRLK